MGVVVIKRKITTITAMVKPINICPMGDIGNNPTNPCKTDNTATTIAKSTVLDLSIESIICRPLHRVYRKCFSVYF